MSDPMTPKVWQLQVRRGTDVLWFEQGELCVERDNQRDLRAAADRARDWAHNNDATDATLFVTTDPDELAKVAIS